MKKKTAKKLLKKAGCSILYHSKQPLLVIDRYGLIELTGTWKSVKAYLWTQL